MAKEKRIQPQEQKSVLFYDDELTAVRGDDGQVYVSLRLVCGTLGIDTQGQKRRINRNKTMSKGLMVANLSTIQGQRDTDVLRVDLIPLWLSGIRTNAVKEELQSKLEKFQDEAARVLWDAFQAGELTTNESDVEELAKIDPEAAEALVMAQAVVKLARSHLRLARNVQGNTQRIEALEATVNDDERHVTDEQASQISQAVKGIALALSKASGKNEFGGVYGELYRRQGVTSYKMIKAADFEKCIAWLNEWYQSAAGDDLHF